MIKKPRKQTTLSMVLGLLIGAAGIAYGVVRWQEHPVATRGPQQGGDPEGLRDPQAPPPEDTVTSTDRAVSTAWASPISEAREGSAGGAGTAARNDRAETAQEGHGAEPGEGHGAGQTEGTHGATAVNEGGKGGPPGGAGTVTLRMEPLVVNLDEGDQLRYLKISLQIEVVSEAQPRAQTNLPKARHEALMYLASLHLADTQGMLGKQRIHRELQRRIADALGGGMKRIYFDEFVVQ